MAGLAAAPLKPPGALPLARPPGAPGFPKLDAPPPRQLSTQQLQLKRPPLKPELLTQQPPAGAPTTAAPVGVSSVELVRPNPPSLRVLEPLLADAEAAGPGRSRPALQIDEVVEDDGELDALFDGEDDEFMSRSSGMRAKGKRGKRKEKVCTGRLASVGMQQQVQQRVQVLACLRARNEAWSAFPYMTSPPVHARR
jgi:hypothetical protein